MTSHQPRHLRVIDGQSEPEASPPTPPIMTAVPEHRVRIRLLYIDWSETGNGRRSEVKTDTPWKWRADCTCGWGCLSWSWSREYEVLQSGLTREQYIAECSEPVGGTLPMALEHLSEKAAETNSRRVQHG